MRLLPIGIVLVLASGSGLALAASPPEASVPYPEALGRATVDVSSLDEPAHDALLLGNGDLNGLLLTEGDDLVFNITKNDVWDARLDTKPDPPLPTLARLKELSRGPWPDRKLVLPEGSTWKGPDSYNAHAYPCPRACARVRIKGAGRPPLAASLDIARAEVEVRAADLSSRLFVAADSNVILLTTHPKAELDLEPIRSDDLPVPNQGKTATVRWITQKIPGDDDWPGMRFAVARASREGLSAIAVVTSMESDDPLGSAIQLAERTLARDRAQFERTHRGQWRSFWAASGIELEDPLLERVWYRSLYLLRCVAKPGVVSAGLFAGLVTDKPAWHGDYHMNYNIQQTYWSVYATNHCDLSEPYDRLISDYLPRARWLARRTYDCEGAFFPLVIFAYEPPDPEQCKNPNGRQYFQHVWGWTLGVSGMTVQPLWWRYKHEPNQDYLRNVAYPAVRDVADFYASFVEQCERAGDKVILGPTMSPEHWGWTLGFERNLDCTFDIAMFRFTLDAAIEGALALGTDRAKIERWEATNRLLPAYPVHKGPPEIVLDVRTDQPKDIYNLPVPVTPIFPGDQVGWFSPEPVQALFRRTMEHHMPINGNNSTVILGMARVRLATPDAYDWLRTELGLRERHNGTLSLNRLEPPHRFNDFGLYSEMAGAALPVTEMLMQSVGKRVRLFPAWPASMTARFRNLRALGGFLVSAEHRGGQVKALEVRSTAGQELALVSPWKRAEVRTSKRARWGIAATDADGVIHLQTRIGQELTFRPRR